jgi:hypothetical protein
LPILRNTRRFLTGLTGTQLTNGSTPALDHHAIVYFGNDWFGENRTSSHHIARRLGARFRLLYVEVPGLRAPSATGRDLSKLWRKLAKSVEAPHQIGPAMWHMTLPQIPYRNAPGVAAVNRWFGSRTIRRAVAGLGFERIVTWFLVPHPGFLAGQCGESMSVYYAVDDYSALPGVDAAQVARMDRELTQAADLVFGVSPSIVAAKEPLNPHTIFSPHGVDAELFGRAADLSLPIPEPARHLPHPVVGFFGVLDQRLDAALVEYLARQRPNWSFLFVGRIAVDATALKALPNVCVAGAVPYETVPDWARAFDVCIMPYRQDAFSKSANPLKMREYLATGRAVVSAPLPEVARFGGGVLVARNYEEFLAQLDTALASDTPAKRRERMESVASMTWEARTEAVIAQAEKRLTEKLAARSPRSA